MPIITSDASVQKAGRGLRIVGVVYAVLLILAGLFALAAPVVATLAAAAVAGLMLILGGVVGLLGAASERGRHLWLQVLWSVLALGFGFLYLPILLLMVYSYRMFGPWSVFTPSPVRKNSSSGSPANSPSV